MTRSVVHLVLFALLAYAPCAAAQYADGDVWGVAYETARERNRILDASARTSVPDGELALDVLVGGPVTGAVDFTATVLSDGGREVRRFTSRAELPDTGPVHLAWPWPRPPLWDSHSPSRFTLRVRASGPDWEHEVEYPFGFRSLAVEGTKLLLNGTPLRLRLASADPTTPKEAPDPAARIEAWRDLGFNAALLPVQELDDARRWAEAADREGFFLVAGLPAPGPPHPFVEPFVEPWPPAAWTDEANGIVAGLRGHPSILMWWLDGAPLSWADDLHPDRLGRPAREPLPPGWGENAAAYSEVVASIKRLDSTRPVMVRGGGPVGDVYAVDTQLGLHPLQERSAWLGSWAANGTMPLAVPALGTPRDVAFHRGRQRAEAARRGEPWITEYAAGELGAWAYLRETGTYRSRLALRDQLRSLGMDVPQLGALLEPGVTPVFHDVQDRFIRPTWRAWRTWGVNAGLMPRDAAYARAPSAAPGQASLQPVEEALRDVNRDTLAWIAGPPGKWTSVDHHFIGSETVTKQIVLINDRRTPCSYRFLCEVSLEGETIRRFDREGRVGPGGQVRKPVVFTIPELESNGEGSIRLEATIGSETHHDVFLFRSYPHLGQGLNWSTVLVFDPEGDTTDLLRRVGVQTEPWDGSPLGQSLLIIGRNALLSGSLPPASLERFIADGGRVILCAHPPEWLREHLGLRVSPHVHRQIWPVASQHENFALADLDARDLRDWRGAGSLVSPFDELRVAGPPQGRVWHWGNEGSVCSAMIEKPHHGGWTPLLEGGFDLAWSPLLELRRGPGMILLNMLDLEARGAVDPAADRIMQQLVNYAAQSEDRDPPPGAAYLGGEQGRRLLQSMGFLFEDTGGISRHVRLLVVDGETTLAPHRLEAFVEEGGLLVMLAPWPDDLPFRLFREARTLGGYAPLVNGEICEGLSTSDLHTRLDVEAEVVKGPYLVSIGDGIVSRKFYGQRGEAWLVALTPYLLDQREDSYQRFSRWRLTRALSQVLANLGGRFEVDRRIFAWDRSGREPVSLAGQWRVKMGDAEPRTLDEAAWPPGPAGGGPAPWLERPGHGAWMRRDFALPGAWRGYDAVLELGPLRGVKGVYLNGEPLALDVRAPVFRCRIPAARLRPGAANTVSIYAADLGDGAGLTGQADEMRIYVEGEPDAARWYVPGYRTDIEGGDDPARFARWDD